ncbi:MAG: hypothetical protein RL084_2074, partial [Pseudomonadota bacterium]
MRVSETRCPTGDMLPRRAALLVQLDASLLNDVVPARLNAFLPCLRFF